MIDRYTICNRDYSVIDGSYLIDGGCVRTGEPPPNITDPSFTLPKTIKDKYVAEMKCRYIVIDDSFAICKEQTFMSDACKNFYLLNFIDFVEEIPADANVYANNGFNSCTSGWYLDENLEHRNGCVQEQGFPIRILMFNYVAGEDVDCGGFVHRYITYWGTQCFEPNYCEIFYFRNKNAEDPLKFYYDDQYAYFTDGYVALYEYHKGRCIIDARRKILRLRRLV